MDLKYFFNFLKKYKLTIAIVILLFLFFTFFNKLKEGYTNCNQIKTNCKDCTNAYIQRVGNICYWNNKIKKCDSYKDEGYSKKCDNEPTPTPNPPPDEDCPVCPSCSSLKMTELKYPTYVTPQ